MPSWTQRSERRARSGGRATTRSGQRARAAKLLEAAPLPLWLQAWPPRQRHHPQPLQLRQMQLLRHHPFWRRCGTATMTSTRATCLSRTTSAGRSTPTPCCSASTRRVRVLSYPHATVAASTLRWHVRTHLLPLRLFSLRCAAAPVLDDEFKVAFNLTYNTFGGDQGDTGVDTEPFRTAIWYYIQRLYGICNDHYDYKQVRAEARTGRALQ